MNMRLAALIVGMMILGFAIFGLFPEIDLAVASWFYRPELSPPWFGQHGFMWTLRNIYYDGVWYVLAAFIVIWAYKMWRDRAQAKIYGFFILLAIIGPIGIVNGILKAFWGRARPSEIMQFGGDLMFTPAQIVPVDQCSRDCSFVSGEGAASFAMFLMGLAMFGGTPLRNALISVLILPMAFMRIVAGGHFLSDVLFSGLVVALVFVMLLRVMRMNWHDLRIV